MDSIARRTSSPARPPASAASPHSSWPSMARSFWSAAIAESSTRCSRPSSKNTSTLFRLCATCRILRACGVRPRRSSRAGFRGARSISAEASARGEWKPGGSAMPGADAYATSKQCTLATAIEFARETPRLRFNALEPGFTPNTGLGREANVFLRVLANSILPLLAPFMKYWSTPKQAARVATNVLMDESGQTGVYYDENGDPMLGSSLVRDPTFTRRVVAETRALLSTIPTEGELERRFF